MSSPSDVNSIDKEFYNPENLIDENYEEEENIPAFFLRGYDNENSLCDDTTTDESTDSEDEEDLIPEYEAIGSWGTYGVNVKAWCDKYREVVKFKSYEDLVLTDLEKSGYLTERIIASCSSYLEKCPEVRKLVLCKCVLCDKGLKNIEIMKYHHFLQYVDLSWNQLEDVTAMAQLPYLIYLDVSYNKLEHLLNFKAPHCLTNVNYAGNLLTEIPDLTVFWSIKTLNLSHNYILKIKGVKNLKYLELLDLSYNQIEVIENLDYMHLTNLNLQGNKIKYGVCNDKLGFKTMPYLSYIRLSYNELTSLQIFENCGHVQSIDMSDNNLSNLLEISNLRGLPLLVSVNFENNPIKGFENYEIVCLEAMKKLKYLDGNRVESSQKVLASTSLNPNIKLKAVQDHLNLLTLSHLTKFPSLGLDVIPADEPPRPIIIIVSPIGSKQERLIQCFVRKYGSHATRLISHIDREKYFGETDDDYYFVNRESFLKLLENGEFLMIYDVFNNLCGLTQDEYARCLQINGKVMITHADLSSALALRIRGFRPMLVLAMPESLDIHKQWLAETYETCIYNIRYPEAAIKIVNRENYMDSSIECSETFSSRESTKSEVKQIKRHTIECENEHENDYDYECNCFDYPIIKINPTVAKYLQIHDNTSTGENEFPYPTFKKFPWRGGEDVGAPYFPYDYGISYEGSTVNFPEGLVDEFYKNVLKSRETYLEFHLANPGIFCETVFTDNMEEALEKLKNVAKIAIHGHFLSKNSFSNINPIDHIITKERIKLLESDFDDAMWKNVPCPNKQQNV